MAVKKEFIKIRVTKDEKEKLKEISGSEKMTLSSYMLEKSLCTEKNASRLLPGEVETWDFFNEIYHQIQKRGNEELKGRIEELYREYAGSCGKEGK